MKVREVMRAEIAACDPRADLGAAGRLMASARCGALPVVDAERRVVGMISDRDVCLAVAGRDQRPSEVRVGDVMNRDVATCRPGDNLRQALATMRERRAFRLAVVDEDGRLAGLLTLDGVVQQARAIETTGFTGPLYADVALTLKALGRPAPAVLAA
jgi:CBS domain-containing protein